MRIADFLRHIVIDLLAQRDDRCYWRQSCEARPLPNGAQLVLWQPDGKLGDGILNARLVHDLRVQRPDVRVHVVCPPGMLSFWQRLPGVHAVHSTAQGEPRKSLVATLQGCEAFVSFETFLSLDTVRLVRALKPVRTLGFSVSRYRLFTDALVDTTYEFPRQHIGERLLRLCTVLGLAHLASSDVASTVRSMSPLPVKQRTGTAVFFNTYAANADRCLTPEVVAKVHGLVRSRLPQDTVILSLPAAGQAAPMPDEHTHALPPCASVWELMQHIDACALVITPDTAIAHLGAVLGKPVLVFYRDRHYNTVVWRPDGACVKLLLPTVIGDINTFDMDELVSAIDSILGRLPS